MSHPPTKSDDLRIIRRVREHVGKDLTIARIRLLAYTTEFEQIVFQTYGSTSNLMKRRAWLTLLQHVNGERR